MTTKAKPGMKYDEQKQKWFSLPLEILEPLADLMEAGAKKYERFNCLEPFEDSSERFYNAMLRHIKESQRNPLAIDTDTGCYHLACVAFNSLMRLYHTQRELEGFSDETCDPS